MKHWLGIVFVHSLSTDNLNSMKYSGPIIPQCSGSDMNVHYILLNVISCFLAISVCVSLHFALPSNYFVTINA